MQMNKVYKFKLDLKKSKIPKYIKLPNYVLPQYPSNKKPNTLLIPKIDLKKAEFLFLGQKDKGGYFISRIDPYPIQWTGVHQLLLLEKDKKEDGFYEHETTGSGMHISSLPFRHYRISFNEQKKILINDIGWYAGKTRDKLKYFDETILFFDLISVENYVDNFEVLPTDVKRDLSEINLNESLEIVSKKPKKSKQLYSRRAFAYQNIFSSYDQYNLIILAEKIHELKYDLLNSKDDQLYLSKKHFWELMEQFGSLHSHIKKTESVKSFGDIFAKLSFDKDHAKYDENLNFYMKLFDEYWEANRKKN